jgi:FkbM family methyltransferase
MNTNQIREIIDVAYKKYEMIQNPIEIQKFSEFFVSLNCKNILEIGTFLGGTFYTMCKLSNVNGKKISIDCLDVIAPGSEVVKQRHKEIDEYLVKFASNVVIIRDNSKSEQCLQKLEKELHGESLDFIFIDGDHTYEGVKSDFNNYKKYLKDGGYIAFHDIDYPSSTVSFGCEVYKFWNELKEKYEFVEFKQGSFGGIGLVKVFKHKRKVNINVEYESPNKINFINEGELNLTIKISIRDRDTKIPIYFCDVKFVQNCPIIYVIPLINYNFDEDENFSGFLIDFIDENENVIDTRDLKIKERKTDVINYTRNYNSYDGLLFMNYKQFFYDKIYDKFITDDMQTVIDIGANVGLFSNYISWKENVKLIHAIEPASKPFNELKKQFYYYNHVKCHKIGIHYNSGKLPMKINNESSILNTFLNVDSSTDHIEEINTYTLPQFISMIGLDVVDLIKMDIEGLEYEVLNSMNDSQILKCKNWLIEYHINDDGKCEILQNRFKRIGYNVTDVPDNIPNNIGIQGFFFAKKI